MFCAVVLTVCAAEDCGLLIVVSGVVLFGSAVPCDTFLC